MKPNAKKSVTIPINLTVSLEDKLTFPMVGWSDPFGSFEMGGRQYKVAIAGGCKSVWVTDIETGRSFSVSIENLIAIVLPYLSKLIGGAE